MTVAAVGAGRVAAAGGARAVGTRGAGSGRVVPGRVTSITDKAPASSSTKSAAGGAAAGSGLGELFGRAGSGRARGRSGPGTPGRRLLVAEFALCLVVLALSPLTDKNKSESPAAFMKRASAVMGVFFVLGLVSTAGRGAARAAAGFGGLVTLALLISSRSIFPVLATKFGTSAGERDPLDEGDDEPYDRPDVEPVPDPQDSLPRDIADPQESKPR